MTTKLSASGARIRGDDYQHLFAWYQALRGIARGSNVSKIGIEDPNAENADDVTVYMENGKREYYQVKSSVDARKTAGINWLTESSKAGSSIIRGFYKLWAREQDGPEFKITLMTNRLPSADDSLLSMRDGRDGAVTRHLQNARPESKIGIIRKNLAEHLGITETEVVKFFHDLRFMLGITDNVLTDWVEERMSIAGLRHDKNAVMQGAAIVRGWVTEGKREITPDELRHAIEPLRQPGDTPTASLLIQMIDRGPVPEDTTIVIDWLDLFPGDEPRVRRQPSDPDLWNGRFRPELKQAAQDLQSHEHAHVLVKGHMRLPTWFAVGVELGKTAGFEVSSFQNQVDWSSVGGLSSVPIKHVTTILELGRDLAVGIALATDPSPEVLTYLRDRQISVEEYVCIQPTSGATNQAIGNTAEARGWAYKVRDLIRNLVREYKPSKIHLFLAGPHGAIFLLGHLWDRMPRTQLYEDLGSTKGYAPSYLIPG